MTGIFADQRTNASVRWINLRNTSAAALAPDRPKQLPTDGTIAEGMPYFEMKEGEDSLKTASIEGFLKGIKLERTNEYPKKSHTVIFQLEDGNGQAYNLSIFMGGAVRDILNNIIGQPVLSSIKISVDKTPKNQGGNWLAIYVNINGTYEAGKWTGWQKAKWFLQPGEKKSMAEVITNSRGEYVSTDNYKLDEFLLNFIDHAGKDLVDNDVPSLNEAIAKGDSMDVDNTKMFGEDDKQEDILDELARVEKE